MLEVLHFDHTIHAGVLRDLLKFRLSKFPDINYEYFKEASNGFEYCKPKLEQILPRKDILLIHPGGAQGIEDVKNYRKRFPNLNIALLVPDTFNYRNKAGDIALLNWDDEDEIIEYIRSINKDRFGRSNL